MNQKDKRARDLERLETAQRRTREQMAMHQKRIDKRFERMRVQLTKKYGEPSDSQQRIIDASLELLREDGLANITLRKLASRISMQAPALYWHFASKEMLVDYMAEAILEKQFKELLPRQDDETWQSWLSERMKHLRQAMLAYPDGARVVAGAHLYPAVSLARLMEVGLISLHSSGISLKTARQIITTATTYTFGYVIEEQAAPTREELEEYDLEAFFASYPNIIAAIAGDDRSQEAQDRDFLNGLNYIITGASQQN